MDEKSYKNILIYDVWYIILLGAKFLSLVFGKVDRFIGDYDGTGYLVLLGVEKDIVIYDRIRYIIRLKSDITCLFS